MIKKKQNMKTVILYGLRRSGNHYLISLVLNQFKNYVHINDCNLNFETYQKYRRIKKTADRSDKVYVGFKGVDCVVLSVENKKINWEEVRKFKGPKDVHVLVLLRHPVGNFCSMWRVFSKTGPISDRGGRVLTHCGDLWRQYARAITAKRRSYPFIPVLYEHISGECKNEVIQDLLWRLGIKEPNFTDAKRIRYQRSSFRDQSCSRRTGDTLDTCPYAAHKPFRKFMEDEMTGFVALWENVITRVTTQPLIK